MKKLLGIVVLGFLFSGNANAGINEPGISFLSFQCKAGFDTEHYKIKKLVKKIKLLFSMLVVMIEVRVGLPIKVKI